MGWEKGFQMSKIALVVDSKFAVAETGLSLAELQAGVDGLIQPIDIRENLTMWVNEEFRLRSEPDPNVVASAFFEEVGGNYAIHGSVVFTGGTDEDGEVMGLPVEHQELVKRLCEFAVDFQN
jgi:hypothetical protein